MKIQAYKNFQMMFSILWMSKFIIHVDPFFKSLFCAAFDIRIEHLLNVGYYQIN